MSDSATRPDVTVMYALYMTGLTYQQVGEMYGVTRQRVQQLFERRGFRRRTPDQTRAVRRLQPHAAARAIEMFQETKDVRAVASQLRAPIKYVDEVLRAAGLVPLPRKPPRPHPRFTEEEMCAFLREASRAIGGVMTVGDYDAVARTRLAADGGPWPTHQAHQLRFGSWRAALAAASLRANPSSAICGRFLFTRAHCIQAIREVADSLGHDPTAREYEIAAQRSTGTLPSLSTIRIRLGCWTEALRLAGADRARSQRESARAQG